MMAEFREKHSPKANLPMLSTVLKDIHTYIHTYIHRLRIMVRYKNDYECMFVLPGDNHRGQSSVIKRRGSDKCQPPGEKTHTKGSRAHSCVSKGN